MGPDPEKSEFPDLSTIFQPQAPTLCRNPPSDAMEGIVGSEKLSRSLCQMNLACRLTAFFCAIAVAVRGTLVGYDRCQLGSDLA
jgi:hypothetical protein